MGSCTAVNCPNTSSKGFCMFRFPRDSKRRAMWVKNCCRDKWLPTNSSELCEIHFEEGQFEKHRQDGLKKLKQNAVPTLFDVTNPSSLLETKRKSCKIDKNKSNNATGNHSKLSNKKCEFLSLQEEKKLLETKLQMVQEALKEIMND